MRGLLAEPGATASIRTAAAGGRSNAGGRAERHLRRPGLSDNSGYLGGLMKTLAADGVVTRNSKGEYIDNCRHPKIEWLRLQSLMSPTARPSG